MDKTERHIVHLDQDAFFVSVERLQNSRLQGRPVIIGGLGERGVVAGCSYEARQFGVHSAMPMRLARELCADAVFIRGDMQLYSNYSNMVTQIIAEQAPVFEKASIDEHYLDITGMDRFFGCRKWASELRSMIIRETGLPVSMGLSPNKTVSKIATGQAKPNGQLQVAPPMVNDFLSPLPVKKIPMAGPKTCQLLHTMGIRTIGTLRQVPPEVIRRMLGKNGLLLWQRANGIDESPVEPWDEHKSISTETTFATDTTDMERIHELLAGMCEQLAFRLRRSRQLTGCVTVKIRYANFDTHSLQQTLPYTSFDHVLIPACKELVRRLYRRRMLIRLVGIQFSRLVHGVQQLNLFEETPELVGLYQAVDRMRRKYGAGILHRAVTPAKKAVGD
jgi:DNA polymerase-4